MKESLKNEEQQVTKHIQEQLSIIKSKQEILTNQDNFIKIELDKKIEQEELDTHYEQLTFSPEI